MHICVLSLMEISAGSSNWGGVQTHTKNLVHLLLKEGYHVSLITGKYEGLKNSALNIISIGSTHSGSPNKLWFEKANKAFLDLHANHPVDCVFSEGGAVRGLMKLMSNLKIPVAVFVHNLSMYYFYNKWQEVDGFHSLKSYLLRTLPTIIYDIFKMDIAFLRQCQKVVTGSSTIAKQMHQFYRLTEKQIMVINNWVESSIFVNDINSRQTLRKQLNISDNEIVFLFVGSVWKPKGTRLLLQAFNDLMQTTPDAYLLIAGDGPDRSYIEGYVKQSKSLHGRVKSLGYFPHNRLPLLLSSADVFIVPSLLNEVLPYTLLEAMSCELPVIATDIAANREALGSTGCFVPRHDIKSLKDAILFFASTLPERRAEAILHRERVINHFSYEVASRQINNLIKELVNIS